jgi:hypothetical protein
LRRAQLGVWLTKVCEIQPPEADAAAWRRSCAVRTLAKLRPGLGHRLLELLLTTLQTGVCPSSGVWRC